MTYQGKLGYPYCPVCNKELKDAEFGVFQNETTVQCTHCGTEVTVAKGPFKPKIESWEAPKGLQSELQQGEGAVCTKCGQKLPVDSNYCNKCGTKLPNITP